MAATELHPDETEAGERDTKVKQPLPKKLKRRRKQISAAAGALTLICLFVGYEYDRADYFPLDSVPYS